MTKKNSLRGSFLASLLSLVLCCVMFAGTTYAWFTDSASTSVNSIKSGKLGIALVDADGNSVEGSVLDFVKAGDAEDEALLWEPGCTYVLPDLFVENNGELALKYQIVVDGIEGDAKLLEAIEWSVMMGGAEISLADYEGHLAAGEKASEALVISGHMLESAGNEYQNLSLDGISIKVIATQDTVEHDSFDNQYDADASISSATKITEGAVDLNTSIIASGEATDAVEVTGANTVVTIKGGFYDAADKDTAVWAHDNATVIIEDGHFICDGFGEAATSGNHQDMIYAGSSSTEGGTIKIYGGTFEARSEGAWLLNEKDGKGTIEVYGGTFVNWNPADNVSEGAGTNFVMPGYTVVEEAQANGDIHYTVVAAE